MDRARAGDRAAMDALVERYGPLVRSALHATMAPDVRARVDTDDLFQSTMTTALADLRGFVWSDEPSFRAWLLTVARREAQMAGRFHRRQGRTPEREGSPESLDAVAAGRTTPSVAATRGETARRLEEAVQDLDPEERKVVELHSFRGLTFTETARLAGLPGEDAARQLFRRALKRLGKLMSEGAA